LVLVVLQVALLAVAATTAAAVALHVLQFLWSSVALARSNT
jgi:hypothetical protein